jgi:hypothetical protein
MIQPNDASGSFLLPPCGVSFMAAELSLCLSLSFFFLSFFLSLSSSLGAGRVEGEAPCMKTMSVVVRCVCVRWCISGCGPASNGPWGTGHGAGHRRVHHRQIWGQSVGHAHHHNPWQGVAARGLQRAGEWVFIRLRVSKPPPLDNAHNGHYPDVPTAVWFAAVALSPHPFCLQLLGLSLWLFVTSRWRARVRLGPRYLCCLVAAYSSISPSWSPPSHPPSLCPSSTRMWSRMIWWRPATLTTTNCGESRWVAAEYASRGILY